MSEDYEKVREALVQARGYGNYEKYTIALAALERMRADNERLRGLVRDAATELKPYADFEVDYPQSPLVESKCLRLDPPLSFYALYARLTAEAPQGNDATQVAGADVSLLPEAEQSAYRFGTTTEEAHAGLPYSQQPFAGQPFSQQPSYGVPAGTYTQATGEREGYEVPKGALPLDNTPLQDHTAEAHVAGASAPLRLRDRGPSKRTQAARDRSFCEETGCAMPVRANEERLPNGNSAASELEIPGPCECPARKALETIGNGMVPTSHEHAESAVPRFARAALSAPCPMEAVQSAFPATFYAGVPLEKRVALMVQQWNRAVAVNQDLEADIERLESFRASVIEAAGHGLDSTSTEATVLSVIREMRTAFEDTAEDDAEWERIAGYYKRITPGAHSVYEVLDEVVKLRAALFAERGKETP